VLKKTAKIRSKVAQAKQALDESVLCRETTIILVGIAILALLLATRTFAFHARDRFMRAKDKKTTRSSMRKSTSGSRSLAVSHQLVS
jgi:hypothetical protein